MGCRAFIFPGRIQLSLCLYLRKEARAALNSGVSYKQNGYWEELQEWGGEVTKLQCAALRYLGWEKIYVEFLVCIMATLSAT